ncbi:MAG TPA: tetratricopeptide repeat protein [Chthoniobacterales bacterium]|nr:tetratricopeptide repeat protein [Chthoniobacterales bacterium]
MITRELPSLLFLIATAIASPSLAAEADKDPQMLRLLQEARALIDSRKAGSAIEKCEKVIAAFEASYSSRKEKIYCARSSTESLGYLLKAAATADKGSASKPGAIVLSSIWADAYFMKGYALQDLGRIAEAKASVNQALQFSPLSPQYLCELGEIYELEKNWPKAMQAFKEAEDSNGLAPDESRALELGQARRGIAYVLVELGKLDEAERKYQECLKSDPNDTRAKRELEYVRDLRRKQKR